MGARTCPLEAGIPRLLLNHRSRGPLHRSQTRPVTAGGGRRPTSVFAEAAVAPGRAALALRARAAGQGLVGWVEMPSPGSADGTHAFVSADSAHFALLCLLSASIFLAACTERKWFRYIDGPTLGSVGARRAPTDPCAWHGPFGLPGFQRC
jgi:hypothetical protein